MMSCLNPFSDKTSVSFACSLVLFTMTAVASCLVSPGCLVSRLETSDGLVSLPNTSSGGPVTSRLVTCDVLV